MMLTDAIEDEGIARKLEPSQVIVVDANLLIKRFPGLNHVNPLAPH